jgi:hypothetical protein
MAFRKLDWRKINPAEHFRFNATPMKGGGHDGYSIPLRIVHPDTNEEVYFEHQTPQLRMPFGITEKDVGGKTHYKVAFSFPSVRHDPVAGRFFGNDEALAYFKWIQAIDDFNKDTVVKNLKTWFPGGNKATMKEDVLREFYFNNIWIGEKCRAGEYAPTFSAKLKVRMKDQVDTIVTKFFNQDKKEIGYSDVEGDAGKGLRCYAILSTNGLWFAGKNYGMAMQIKQLLVYQEDNFVGCAIDLPEEPLYTLPPAGEEEREDELEIDIGTKRPGGALEDSREPKAVATGFNMPQHMEETTA